MKNVTVFQMAEARDRRKEYQSTLINTHKYPLISFTLNIPGPVKNTPAFKRIFEEGCRQITNRLSDNIVSINSRDELTGLEAYYSISLSAKEIKQITVEIEVSHRLGRLFDIDVIDVNHLSISRKDLDLEQRKCLICEKPAFICGRNRTHTVEVLLDKIDQISAYLNIN